MTMPTPVAQMTDATTGWRALSWAARVKVCGITEPSEIDLLAGQQVDFVGLWYGVPGGPADLPLDTWRRFGAAAAATGSLAPVMVTFLKDIDAASRGARRIAGALGPAARLPDPGLRAGGEGASPRRARDQGPARPRRARASRSG